MVDNLSELIQKKEAKEIGYEYVRVYNHIYKVLGYRRDKDKVNNGVIEFQHIKKLVDGKWEEAERCVIARKSDQGWRVFDGKLIKGTLDECMEI